MTDEKKKICHEKYVAGIPMTRIAKDLGVSRMTVYRELKKIIVGNVNFADVHVAAEQRHAQNSLFKYYLYLTAQ